MTQEYWYDRAIVLENMNRNIDAIHCYLKTLEISPDFNDAFMRLASVYQKEGKLNELIDVYETAKVNEEIEHIHFLFLAQAYMLDEKGSKAIELIEKAISVYPKENDIKDKRYLNYLIIKGNIYLNMGKIENAIQCYQEVLKIDDEIAQAYINIGCAYVNNKRPKDGIPFLEKAVKLNPKVASIYSNLGNAYYMMGNKEKSLEYFDKAEKLDPSLSGALSSKAAAYMDSGKPEAAILSLIKSIQKDPYNSNVYKFRNTFER